MKVLVIPENPTLDQYILKPVVECLLRELGRGTARVEILQEPHLNGVEQALDAHVLAGIHGGYPMIDLFLLIIDRDGVESRQSRVDARVAEANGRGKSMVGCLAIEEIEVWALAPHADGINAAWKSIRSERSPKEVYFEPFIEKNNWLESVGKGRKVVMKALAGNWRSLKTRCPELQKLQDDVAAWWDTR
jgi:hypothetical protein